MAMAFRGEGEPRAPTRAPASPHERLPQPLRRRDGHFAERHVQCRVQRRRCLGRSLVRVPCPGRLAGRWSWALRDVGGGATVLLFQSFPDHEAVDGAGGGADGFHDVDVRGGERGGDLRLEGGRLHGERGPVVEEDAVQRAGLHGRGFDGGEEGEFGWQGGEEVVEGPHFHRGDGCVGDEGNAGATWKIVYV